MFALPFLEAELESCFAYGRSGCGQRGRSVLYALLTHSQRRGQCEEEELALGACEIVIDCFSRWSEDWRVGMDARRHAGEGSVSAEGWLEDMVSIGHKASVLLPQRLTCVFSTHMVPHH